MSTTRYIHGVLSMKEDADSLAVMYPKTYASDVSVETDNTNLPSDASTAQDLVNDLGSLAFKSAVTSDDFDITTMGDYIYSGTEETDVDAFSVMVEADKFGGHDSTYYAVASDLTTLQTTVTTFMNTTESSLESLAKACGTWLDSVTLASGETTATITDSSITVDSIIDIFFSDTTINPTVTQESGSITVTLTDAATADITIRVKVVNL